MDITRRVAKTDTPLVVCLGENMLRRLLFIDTASEKPKAPTHLALAVGPLAPELARSRSAHWWTRKPCFRWWVIGGLIAVNRGRRGAVIFVRSHRKAACEKEKRATFIEWIGTRHVTRRAIWGGCTRTYQGANRGVCHRGGYRANRGSVAATRTRVSREGQ